MRFLHVALVQYSAGRMDSSKNVYPTAYIYNCESYRWVNELAINLDTLILQIIVNTIIIGPVLWISGRALVGKEKAKFTDGLWIAALGTIIGAIFGYFFTGLVASIIMLVIWLALIKRFFDCGWLKALLIAIVAIIVFVIIGFILVLLGLAAISAMLPSLGVP
jgi:hypothetical protein